MIITDNFSGPVRAIDPVSVRLCVQTVTFERKDHLKPTYVCLLVLLGHIR